MAVNDQRRLSRKERQEQDDRILDLYYECKTDREIADELDLTRPYVAKRRKACGLEANTRFSGIMGETLAHFVKVNIDQYKKDLVEEKDTKEKTEECQKHIKICLHCVFADCINCLKFFEDAASEKKTKE